MVTSGETDGVQGSLKQGCEGLAPQHTVPVKEHHTKLQNRIKYPQGLPRGGEDERPIEQDKTVTTRLIQRTLTGTTAETKCHCGKVCKNLKGLKIHQARTKCGSGKQQRERTVNTDETTEDHSQEAHHSAEDLLPNEATQINIEEEQWNQN